MKKTINILLLAMAVSNVFAQRQDFTIDKNKNVVISSILENLPLSKSEIYAAAQHYITESYKETKYKIVFDDPESGTIAGEGMYTNFHEANYFPYAYFLNAPFTLRIDAKDNRARLSITFSSYRGKRVNMNETIEINDRISNFFPVNTQEDSHKKLYGKAFHILISKAKETLAELEKELKSTQSASNLDQEW